MVLSSNWTVPVNVEATDSPPADRGSAEFDLVNGFPHVAYPFGVPHVAPMRVIDGHPLDAVTCTRKIADPYMA
jgi:hypothetical protein